MKPRLLTAFLMIFCMVFGMFCVSSAAAYTLSLEATSDGSTQATQFTKGQDLYLNIVVDNAAGIAGCAFTLNYPTDVLTPPTTDAEGVSSGITSIFPFTYNDGSTTHDIHRGNSSVSGKIYLAGAAIDTGDGGPLYIDAVADHTLFTIRFTVKSDATSGPFDLSLTQTVLDNADAGYVSPNNTVSVLVGALDNTDGNWGGDLSDDFPVLLGDAANPFSIVTYSACEVLSVPTYSISGTIVYTGSQTGLIYVGAFDGPDPGTANKISCTPINQPGAFTIAGLPNGTYYIGAYRDSDGGVTSPDVMDRDPTEAQGMYPTAVPVSNSNVDGINFSLFDPDSEQDGIPDYWENTHFGNLTTANTTSDYDSDGMTDLEEYGSGTDPKDTDSDNDGYADGDDANPLTADAPGGIGYDSATDTRTYEISGFVSYSGSQAGTLYVKVYDDAGMTSEIGSQSITTPTFPEAYSVTALPAKATYYLEAFIDVTGGTAGQADLSEAGGELNVNIAENMSGSNITVTDPAEAIYFEGPSSLLVTSQGTFVLKTEVPDGETLKAYNIQIGYDNSLLDLISTNNLPTFPPTNVNTTTPGEVIFNGFGTTGVSGPTTFGLLEFTFAGKGVTGSTVLTITVSSYGESAENQFPPQPQVFNLSLVEYERGDADGSGSVDIFDALIVAEYDALLKSSEQLLGFAVSDVDNSGSVDIFDALKIAEFDAGLIPNLD